MNQSNYYLSLASKVGISIEVFPVAPEKYESYLNMILTYEALGVNSINVTCKPTNILPTREVVSLIREHTNMCIIPHIAAYKLTKKELDETLEFYDSLNIKNILAIRGDLDTVAINEGIKPDFLYATDLVSQIKAWDTSFQIGVAGYPERHYQSANCLVEMQHLHQKIQAGADYIITQLFFDNKDYFEFLNLCEIFDISVPIIPGLAYIKNKEHAEVIARIAAGSKIPSPLLREILQGNEESGAQWLHKQVDELSKSSLVNIIHLYVFNSFKVFGDVIEKFINK